MKNYWLNFWHNFFYKNEVILVYTTFPDRKTTEQIGKILINEKLIACINFNPIESKYIWAETIMESQETAAILKTSSWNFQELKKRLIELHPYERPCVLKIKTSSTAEYFNWISEVLK